jgi:hypothetical protein
MSDPVWIYIVWAGDPDAAEGETRMIFDSWWATRQEAEDHAKHELVGAWEVRAYLRERQYR